jgi:hypothetical protein
MRTLLTLSILTLAAASLPARAGLVTLIPSSPIVPGGSFDVTLNLADAFSSNPGDFITSIGFDVNVLDSSVANFMGFAAGSLFFDATFPGSPDVFVIPNDPAGLSTASIGYTDPFTVAVLHFNALKAGATTIQVSADTAADINQGIYYFSSPTAVDFSASTPLAVSAPEPGSLGLTAFALGAIGLGSIRLRRRLPMAAGSQPR